jgi:hypothetical protein
MQAKRDSPYRQRWRLMPDKGGSYLANRASWHALSLSLPVPADGPHCKFRAVF